MVWEVWVGDFYYSNLDSSIKVTHLPKPSYAYTSTCEEGTFGQNRMHTIRMPCTYTYMHLHFFLKGFKWIFSDLKIRTLEEKPVKYLQRGLFVRREGNSRTNIFTTVKKGNTDATSATAIFWFSKLFTFYWT
jgi:hypothetical protein